MRDFLASVMVRIVPSELALHSHSDASVPNHVSVLHVFGGPDTKATPQKLSYSTSLDGLGTEPGLEVSAGAFSGERRERRRLGDPSGTSNSWQEQECPIRKPQGSRLAEMVCGFLSMFATSRSLMERCGDSQQGHLCCLTLRLPLW